jgi:hypothetical protein
MASFSKEEWKNILAEAKQPSQFVVKSSPEPFVRISDRYHLQFNRKLSQTVEESLSEAQFIMLRYHEVKNYIIVEFLKDKIYGAAKMTKTAQKRQNVQVACKHFFNQMKINIAEIAGRYDLVDTGQKAGYGNYYIIDLDQPKK